VSVSVASIRAQASLALPAWFRQVVFWPAALILTGSICLLAIIYLGIPAGVPQPPGWSPRPDHASEVAQLYRTHLGISDLYVSADLLRILNPLLLVLSGIAYVLILWARPAGVPARCLAVLSAPLAAATLFMPPLYATDIFYYGVAGEIATRFGANPYLHTPADFPSSALLPFNYWTDITSPYGPIWTTVSSVAAAASGWDPFLCTLALKFVGLVAVAASALGIASFLRSTRPDAARAGLTLFVLNPFVWLTAVGDGHVDMMMGAFMLAAACLLARNRRIGAWCAISLATLVKYLTGPLLLLFLLARGRARFAALLCLAGGGLAVITWGPYWAGLSTLSSLLEEGSRGYSAPPLLLIAGLGDSLGAPDGVIELLTNVVAMFMLAGLVVWLLRAVRHASASKVVEEVRGWALTMTAIPALLPRSHPWYFLTGMALLAAVYPRSRRVTLIVYAAAGAWFLWRVGRI
jgi:hypothetical protein